MTLDPSDWMWASGRNRDLRRAAHHYEPTREAANGGVREKLAAGSTLWEANRKNIRLF